MWDMNEPEPAVDELLTIRPMPTRHMRNSRVHNGGTIVVYPDAKCFKVCIDTRGWLYEWGYVEMRRLRILFDLIDSLDEERIEAEKSGERLIRDRCLASDRIKLVGISNDLIENLVTELAVWLSGFDTIILSDPTDFFIRRQFKHHKYSESFINSIQFMHRWFKDRLRLVVNIERSSAKLHFVNHFPTDPVVERRLDEYDAAHPRRPEPPSFWNRTRNKTTHS